MGRHTTIIPYAPVKDLLKGSFSIRVSLEAAKSTSQYLEHVGKDVATLAAKNALFKGKRTIDEHDVELAIAQLTQQQ